MLLGALAENIFGFSGTYARKKQASLDPILTGWKRWMEFNTTSDGQMPRTDWLLNLSHVNEGVQWIRMEELGKALTNRCLAVRELFTVDISVSGPGEIFLFFM